MCHPMTSRPLSYPLMKHVSFIFSALAFLLPASVTAAEFKDDFAQPKLEHRRAARGEWKIADGIARCTQDDELYKKNKDHGPIIFYDVPTKDSVIRFSFKPQGVKNVVFTLNGASNHVFRILIGEKGATTRAFPAGSKEHNPKALAQDGPKIAQGEWTEVTVEIRGAKATVKIGKDYSKTVEDPAIARPKTNISIGFSFGSLEVKGFEVGA